MQRRPLLKALGAGTALSLGTSVATAHEDENGDDNGGHSDDDSTGQSGDDAGDTVSRPPHLDPYYGFTVPDAREVPGYIQPDHEVTLHVAPPENLEDPDHPTFFFFKPVGLQVSPGDVVQFTAVTPDHTVTAYHPAQGFQRRVPEGTPHFSSPVLNAGGAWLYQFEREGVYDLYCGPHHVLGMVMRVIVGELDEENVPEYESSFQPEQPEAGPPLLPPFSKEFLEHELNALSDANEDCEWPWLTPVDILDADHLDPDEIQSTHTGMSFETVVGELGFDFEHSHE